MNKRSTHHLDTLRKYQEAGAKAFSSTQTEGFGKSIQRLNIHHSHEQSAASESQHPTLSTLKSKFIATHSSTFSKPEGQYRRHIPTKMTWIEDKKRHVQMLKEKKAQVDADFRERDKQITQNYKNYMKRVALKDKLEAETELEREIRLKYFNKRGQPLRLTIPQLFNAFTPEEL